jgi:peptidoglycan-associated lipoprotein
MNLSTISKSLLIALPMLALGACSSTSDSDAESSEANNKAATEEVVENAVDNTVETDVIVVIELSAEEQLVQKYTWAILETTINFAFDKSTIAPRFTKILDAHAKFLVENTDQALTVEGYTDEIGTPEYNIALGERRANSVATYLENMGVSASQISVVSYGEEKPVNLDHDAAAEAENRRVELVY